MVPPLSGAGDLVTKDMEKAEVLNGFLPWFSLLRSALGLPGPAESVEMKYYRRGLS